MWLWGLLNLVAPWIASIVLGLVALAIKSPALQGILMIAAFIIPWLLLTVFANALYWRHINNVIRDVPQSFADKPDKRARRIERNGGTGLGAMIGVMFGVLFFGGGILAAIAIPAYQDYTIRSQVSEGLVLSAGAKAAVAEYFAQNNGWPADGAAAGFEGVSGKYVESVKVENGSVVISYGGAANRNLAGKTVILLPGANANKDIIWMCANASSPDGVEKAPGPSGTDVPNKYLPMACRPT
jgi:type IV pilus assembly protein PilA